MRQNFQKYFEKICFIGSFFDLSSLPSHSGREVVVAGRSNCGKSSIINSVTGKSKLSITSKSPGRTRSINYFKVKNNQYLIDLPGYGYAKVSNETKQQWHFLLEGFFNTRKQLCGVVLIMDIRHPVKSSDLQLLNFCRSHALPVHVVLNKADKLSSQQILHTQHKTVALLETLDLILSLQICSAHKKIGIEELREQIISWLDH